MKRTPGIRGLMPLVLVLLVAGLMSCDALFEFNLFARLAQPELTVDSIQEQTPSELEDTLDSQDAMNQVMNDPALLDATLDTLDNYYDSEQGGNPESAEGQTAAILAADIIIQTSPVTAQFSAAAVGAIESIMEMADSEAEPTQEEVLNLISSILPVDVLEAYNAGSPTPPESFIEIVATYTQLYDIYTALSSGLESGSYAADIDAGEAVDIAVNALFSGVIYLVGQAVGEGQDIASALWSAMLDPENAGFELDEEAFESVFGDVGSLGNILTVTGSFFEADE